MNQKERDRLEDAYIAQIRQYDQVEWDLYDLKRDNQKILEETQSLLHEVQLQSPETNLYSAMVEVEDRFDDFHRLVLQKEHELEDLRWETKREYMKKTQE